MRQKHSLHTKDLEEAREKRDALIGDLVNRENDKKVSPKRGLILVFTVFFSFFLATLLCNLVEFVKSESRANNKTAAEWEFFVKKIYFWHK